jgi:pseudouridine-5'-phosphate glycosidase
MTLPIAYNPEVSEALKNGDPVVALESTIITHGMPSPRNVETARAVEAVIRNGGAVPATMAVLNGQLHVGLSAAELDHLAALPEVAKLSRADFAHALATGRNGATTVAATMIAARLAGIAVFATGGVGGVHRGAEATFDISADLQELAQSPVTVVAAGVKAILDIPKTLEVLETLGVPVLCYRSDDFPAFWMRSSGVAAPLRVESAAEIARAHQTRGAMGLPGGQLVANPIPSDAAIARSEMVPVIEAALIAAHDSKIAAKEVTPFLLDRIGAATSGRSLEANISLVLNNARLAGEIAREMARNEV